MKTPTKRIVVCADDFSLNPAINAGILDLLAHQRLSAVSCMSQSPGWHEDARRLLPFRGLVDIGLHFNLTHPFSNALCWPLQQLMCRSALRLLPLQKIRASLVQQLDAFEAAMGAAPDFIDGHQHVHQFPQVRDILVDECLRRYPGPRPYIRSLSQMPGASGFKARVLEAMGSKALDRALQQHGISHNAAFAGLYGLTPDPGWPGMMRHWLSLLPANGLVMCHPAQSMAADDSIAAARVAEFRFLSSPDWPAMLADCGVQPGRLDVP